MDKAARRADRQSRFGAVGSVLVGAIAPPMMQNRTPPRASRRRDSAGAARTDANPATAFEPSDWPVGTVALVILGILIVLVVAPLLLWWAYPNAASDVNRALAAPPPEPRLQVHSEADLARFRAAEEHELNTYYWIDKQKGIVRIPIAQAMRTLARRGIAGFPQAPR
jgi:hypothetical protein